MVPVPQTLPALFAEILNARPAQDAAVEGDRRLTYADLSRMIDEEARALLAAGVGRGDRVAFLGEPCPEFWVNFLAVASIGAIWLGLNPKYKERELAYVLGDAGPVLVRADNLVDCPAAENALAAWVAQSADRAHILVNDKHTSLKVFHAEGKTISADVLQAQTASVDPHDTALIVYTSGSSGQPKGAMLTHHGLTYGAKAQHDVFGGQSSRVICNFPINHIACVGDVCATNLASGGTIFFQRQFDPDLMLATIAAEKITVLGGVPTMLQLISLSPGFKTMDLSSLKHVVWGGAALSPDIIKAFQSPGRRLIATYGMTETTANVTHTPVNDDAEFLASSIGRVHPFFKGRVMVDGARPASIGETGELQFRGEYLMTGYLGRPEATREAFTQDGWMRTGDLVEQREDGMMRFVSRISEMYKSGGYNVYPREIEIALEEHKDVALAAVISVPDALYQEVGHAFVMKMPGSGLTADALLHFLKGRLANYKVPKKITVEDMLPILPVGKIDKAALHQILKES